VAEKEKGDLQGRIDRESLGVSLRAGADCLRKLGLEDVARDWERTASGIDA
jgi:hypothetical protein